jgi:hypothetical protein
VDRLTPLVGYRNDSIRLVIRDVVNYKFGPESIMKELGIAGFPTIKASIIFLDEVDTRYKLKCQYERTVTFRKLSIPAKNTVKAILKEIAPGIDRRALLSAYRKAEKGD